MWLAIAAYHALCASWPQQLISGVGQSLFYLLLLTAALNNIQKARKPECQNAFLRVKRAVTPPFDPTSLTIPGSATIYNGGRLDVQWGNSRLRIEGTAPPNVDADS